MSTLAALALLAAIAAQVPPPPPPLDAPPALPELAPDAPDAPDDEAPPALQPRPPVAPEAPRPDAKPPQLAVQSGLDPLLIGALQWAVPCVTFVVAVPCTTLALYICPPAVCIPCILPAANGYLAAFIGDRFGNDRAPAIWTVLAAYGAAFASSVAAVILLVVSSPALANGNITDPFLLGGLATAMFIGAASSLAVPAAYALTAEPKRAGDDGTAAPGWFSPNHPTEPKKRSPKPGEPADAPPTLTAMRF